MRRIHHPYWDWEDYKAGMWEKMPLAAEAEMLERAVKFTGDSVLYGQWMNKVIREWPLACEHNLTAKSINKLAWIGHAAACMAIKSPEYITRRAWGLLGDEQMRRANLEAQNAVTKWSRWHASKNCPMDQALGIEGLC